MTPQEKAKELEQTYNDFTYQACIAMHEWTKQQWIEKALKFLDDNFEYYSGLKIECLLEDFKKAMEEQL